MWWRKLPTLPSASTAPCSAASMRPPGAIGTGGTLGPSRWVLVRYLLALLSLPWTLQGALLCSLEILVAAGGQF